MRYEVGQTERNVYLAYPVSGNGPYATLEEAVDRCRYLSATFQTILHDPITNYAVRDLETGAIVWRQDQSE